MTENTPQKPTDTKRIIEHVENSRVCLMREVLGIGSEIKELNKEQKGISSMIGLFTKHSKRMFCYLIIILIVLDLVKLYQLYLIAGKLVKLGL